MEESIRIGDGSQKGVVCQGMEAHLIKLSRCLHALDASLNVGFLNSPRK